MRHTVGSGVVALALAALLSAAAVPAVAAPAPDVMGPANSNDGTKIDSPKSKHHRAVRRRRAR